MIPTPSCATRPAASGTGLLMEVGRGKLGLPGEGVVEILNVKCDPMLAGALRAQEGFHPAYHMNKENGSPSAWTAACRMQRLRS